MACTAETGTGRVMAAHVVEFLKTCRFHQRTLVIVCVTALLFAVAPSERRKLEKAIQEAELASKIDFQALIGRGVCSDEDANAYVERIANILDAAEIGYARAPHEVLLGVVNPPLPQTGATVEQLQNHILEEHLVVANVPGIDDHFLEDLNRNVTNLEPRSEALYELGLRADGVRKTVVHMRWRGGYEKRLEMDHPIVINRTQVQIDFAELIGTDSTIRHLLVRDDDRWTVFPSLQEFWREVRDLRPRDAVRHLAIRNAYVSENLTFLSLAIPTFLAGVAVPLTTVLLMWHLHLYLRRLTDLPKASLEATVDNFPWPPLFSDRISRLFTFLSYSFLPIVANIFVVWRSFHMDPKWMIVVAGVFTVIFDYYSYPKLIAKLRLLT